MTATADELAVGQLLDRYFDALYHGDSGVLSTILHPEGLYATAHGGGLLRLSIPDYLTLVEGRSKPSDDGAPRDEEILSIEVIGGTMALARVRCFLFGRDYADFLTLLKVGGRWWVLAKLFHYEERRR